MLSDQLMITSSKEAKERNGCRMDGVVRSLILVCRHI